MWRHLLKVSCIIFIFCSIKKQSGWFLNLQSGFSFKFKEVPNSFPVTFKKGKASTKNYFDFWYDFQHSFGGIDYLETSVSAKLQTLWRKLS